MSDKKIEWHGHRGCRGLLPENSMPAFLKALDLGVDALEMDVVISRDKKVVIAHEPYMPASICLLPNGDSIDPEIEQELNLYEMDYDDIEQFNCGQKHPLFPEQNPEAVHRPLLAELFRKAKDHCLNTERAQASFTIELKSHPEFDEIYHPRPEEFVELVIAEINAADVASSCVLQSFDLRILREIRKQAPELSISFLLAQEFDLDESIETLGFKPEIIGPQFELLDKELVERCHQQSIRVVPWTINEVEDMKALIAMGVDGIITDYPNRRLEIGE